MPMRWAYLNTPPITAATKITAAAKSNPATILPISATPRRAIGRRGWRRGSNLEDRNFYYGLRRGTPSGYTAPTPAIDSRKVTRPYPEALTRLFLRGTLSATAWLR
jgi:hypothetical protein